MAIRDIRVVPDPVLRTPCDPITDITPAIRRVISKRGSAEEIKDVALSEGMHTLRMSASRMVMEGITSFSEMIKVSFDNDAMDMEE